MASFDNKLVDHTVSVGGQEMMVLSAVGVLLSMEPSKRRSVLSLSDAYKVAKATSGRFVVTDGVGGTILFFGTTEEKERHLEVWAGLCGRLSAGKTQTSSFVSKQIALSAI